MKRKLGILVFIVSISIMFLQSCSQNSPVAPSIHPEQGKITFALNAAEDIASGTVTITKGSIVNTLPITISNNTGSVVFEGVQVGTWSVAVQLFDAAGVEIYSGFGEAVVSKNVTTTVTILVNSSTGSIEIVIEVPESTVTDAMIVYLDNAIIAAINTDGTNKQIIAEPNAGYFVSLGNVNQAHEVLFWGNMGTEATTGFWKANVNGTGLKMIINMYEGASRNPMWSWDGTKIAAVEAFVKSGHQIFTIDPVGNNFRYLTDGQEYQSKPCWTIDNRIVFYQESERTGISPRGIYIMNQDGTNKQLIKAGNYIPTDVTADNKILHYSDNYGIEEIFIMDLDGSNCRQLTNNAFSDKNAHMNRAGTAILFASNRDGRDYTIYLTDPDFTTVKSVVTGQNAFFVP